MMFLRARSLAMGRSGARPVVAETMLALLAAGLDPVVPEHGSLGASGDLAPLAHCGLVLIGEGEVWTAGDERVPAAEALADAGDRAAHAHAEGGPGPDQRHRRHPRDAAARPPRRDPPAQDGRRHGGDVHGGAARHRPRLRRRPRGAAAPAGPGAQRRQPHAAARRLADRGEPPLRRPARAGRVLAALRAAGERRGPRHARATWRRSPPPSCARRSTTRWSCPTAAWSRAGTSTARRWRWPATSSRSPPPRSARSPSAAPTACSIRARSYGLPPFLTEDAGVNSGLMLAHYTQAAMVAENRRLAVPASTDSLPTSAMQEDHVSMGWGAARKLRTVVANLGRILAVELTCAARALDLRAPLEPGPGTAAARAAVRAVVPGAGSGPLAGAGAGRGRGARGVGRGARRGRGRDREPRVSVRTVHAPRGAELILPGLAAGGRAADADEQPRPRRGRAPRRARRVRRHRAGRALLGGVRRHGPHAADARRRRDDARPVGQAGRRVSHARVGAAGADRELQPRRRVGHLGRVPPARGARPDDVRPDDRGLVDLHRHPGDRAGHLRVLRGDRPPPLRRLARRHDHPHRGARRHGRRAAARGDDERGGGAVRGGRPRSHPAPARDPLPRRGGRRSRRRGRALPARQA